MSLASREAPKRARAHAPSTGQRARRFDYVLLLVCMGLSPWLSGLGCQDPDEPPPDCDRRVGGEAQGYWTIKGEGQRSGCRDPYLNGKMELEVRAFQVEADPVPTHDNTAGDHTVHEADAFVRRIQRAQYVLDAELSVPSRVTFAGAVNTCDVDFTLSERLSDGTLHSYEFDGFVESSRRIYGRFTGSGPGSCKVEGEFEIDID